MADTKQGNRSGKQPRRGLAARGRAVGGAGASRGAGKAAPRTGRRGKEAEREAADAAAGAPQAAGLGGVAPGETAHQDMQAGARETDKAEPDLAAMAGEAAAGLGPLMGAPASGPGGVQGAHQAMSLLLQSVMATNLRFADALLSRAGPSAVAELQRRFMREYFDALARGGTLLLSAARQTAEGPLRTFEEAARGRQGNGPEGGAGSGGGGPQRGAGKVADVMSGHVELASPEDTVQQAARVMGERGTGVLPVGENDRLLGVVTDRDLAVRALAAGKDPTKTKLREVMSGEPRYVFDDESLEKAAAAMAEQQVRRLPVLNRDKRLVGMVSVGDLER